MPSSSPYSITTGSYMYYQRSYKRSKGDHAQPASGNAPSFTPAVKQPSYVPSTLTQSNPRDYLVRLPIVIKLGDGSSIEIVGQVDEKEVDKCFWKELRAQLDRWKPTLGEHHFGPITEDELDMLKLIYIYIHSAPSRTHHRTNTHTDHLNESIWLYACV